MNNRYLRSALIVSFTGFLFGFDSVLISGVNLPIKNYWNIPDWYHGTFIVSISLWGMVAGALVGGYPTDTWGRKPTLLLVGIAFIVSAIGTSLAMSPAMFSVFRFLGGVAAGVGSIAAPAYLTEVSSTEHRGKLGVLFQLNLVTGILLAFCSNYLVDGFDGSNDWRWMLAVMAVPSILFTVAMSFVEESPRWISVKLGTLSAAQKKIAQINIAGGVDTKESNDEDLSVRDMKKRPEDGSASLFSRRYRKILVLSLLITFFNQFSGISFVLFYAPEILEKAGFATGESLRSAVYIGVVNLLSTIAGIALIDKWGRRTLMIIGSAGYIVSLSMISCGFYFQLPGQFMLMFVLLFMVAHAIGQGAVIWVFLAEIFPTKVRAFGQAWGSGLLNGFAAVVALLGALAINAFEPWVIFGFFAALTVLQLLFSIFIMPETKGIPLEELERQV